MKLNVDVLHINGLLHKTDKFFWRIQLFCNETHMRVADFCVLVTTNASNVGINKLSIALQMRFEWLQDLLTYFQEQGCGLQQMGMKSICVLYADLLSYVFLVSQLIRGGENTSRSEENGTGKSEGFNLAISPRRQVRAVNTTQYDYALGPSAKKWLCSCALLELQEVLVFFALIWDVNMFALRNICQPDHLILCPQSGIAQYVLSATAHITRTSSPYSEAVSFHFSSG
jgi:hypothetical protein